jgi:hypothetical protein
MNIRRLLIAITFLALFAMAMRVSMDTDTWWHLRTGAWILDNQAIPKMDPFSYTRADQAWPHPGWLIQVPMLWIYQVAGPGGLNLWVALMVTAAFAFIWKAASVGLFVRAFALVLAAATAGVYWAARPYMATFVLAAAFLWILEDWRWGRNNRLWLLPALMIIWANSHGGFAVGGMLWGVYGLGIGITWLSRRRSTSEFAAGAGDDEFPYDALPALRQMILIGFLMVLAIVVNPNGFQMLAYPFQTVQIEALQDFIQEWQSPNFHELQVHPFIWLLLLTLGAAGASRLPLRLIDFLLVSGFAYLSLLAARNFALFSLVAPIVLIRHAHVLLDDWGDRLGWRLQVSRRPPKRLQSAVNTFLLVLIFAAVFVKAAAVWPVAENEKVFATFLPLKAAEFLTDSELEPNLFNSYNWGAYLLWRLPDYPVFVDGRTDLYNDEIIDEWFQVVRAEPGWQSVLDRWDVQIVLLEPELPIIAELEQANWLQIYADEQAVIYRRGP